MNTPSDNDHTEIIPSGATILTRELFRLLNDRFSDDSDRTTQRRGGATDASTAPVHVSDFLPCWNAPDEIELALSIQPVDSNHIMNSRKSSPFHAFSLGSIVTDGIPTQDDGPWLDRTANELAYRELSDLATLPEKSPDPIIELAGDGHVTFCNAAARRYFPGILIQSAAHPVIGKFLAALDLFAAGKASETDREFEYLERTYEGHFVLNHETQRVRVYLNDVTRLRESERQLRSLRRELTEQQNRFTSVFLRFVHEIRVDMNVVVGFSGLLSDPEILPGEIDRVELGEMIQQIGRTLEERLEGCVETMVMAGSIPPPLSTDATLSVVPFSAPVLMNPFSS